MSQELEHLREVLTALVASYEKICDQMCKTPSRDAAYVAAKNELK